MIKKKQTWLAVIYEKTFVFKYKMNDWMKQTSGSRSRLSKSSHRSSSKSSSRASSSSFSYKSDKFSRGFSKVKAIQENRCAAELLAEAEFSEERTAQYQAEAPEAYSEPCQTSERERFA